MASNRRMRIGKARPSSRGLRLLLPSSNELTGLPRRTGTDGVVNDCARGRFGSDADRDQNGGSSRENRIENHEYSEMVQTVTAASIAPVRPDNPNHHAAVVM